MAVEGMTAGRRPRTSRAGWGWLLLSTVARFYLILMGALAACALVPMLFGLSGSVIQSGSMEPHISTGDVVLSHPVPLKAPAPMGRVITFRAPVGSAKSGLVLHRLVAANKNGTLVTAGDANHNPDSTPLARRNIISQACLLIPWVGLPSYWVTTGAFLPLGIWVLLTMVALMIGAVDAASRQPPAEKPPAYPEGPSGSGPDAEPDEATRATRSRRVTTSSLHRIRVESSLLNRIRRSSLLNRIRVDTGSAAVALVAFFTVAALAMAPLGMAAAALTARTVSTGNSWGAASPATGLAFTKSPSASTGGIAFATQPRVTVQDASGNPVSVSSAPVTLSITTPAGAVLTCTTNPKSAVAGVATFVGCKVDKVGTYTLTAVSSGLTNAVSASFTITVGPAVKLGFTRVPASTTVNTSFSSQPRVAIQDAGGNTRTASSASITLAITPPAGGAGLTNCTSNPRSTSSGVASFSSCRINTAGTYRLTASASGLTSAISTSFPIYGSATRLAFTTSPSDSTGGVVFGAQPVVTVQDAGGRTVSSSSASVTLANPSGATLTCTNKTVTASSGVATFAGCRIDKAGTYTLTATATGLTSAASASFTISSGPATKVAFTTSPSSSTGGIPLPTQPVVTVQDAGGNTVTSSAASVTLSITTPAGAVLTCTTNPTSAVSGVATFAGCAINKSGTYTLTAVSSGLSNGVSASFTISVGPATKLAFTAQPSGAAINIAFATQPWVTVQDAGGNTVTTSGPSVALAITPPTGGAVLSCSPNPRGTSSGVAIFSTCKINTAGTYTLTATSGALTAAVSNSFIITAGGGLAFAGDTSIPASSQPAPPAPAPSEPAPAPSQPAPAPSQPAPRDSAPSAPAPAPTSAAPSAPSTAAPSPSAPATSAP